MCHVTWSPARETDEIRIVGTLSAFDWFDIADGDTKRKIIELMNFFPPQFCLKRKEKGGRHK